MNKLKTLLLILIISIFCLPVCGHGRGGWRQANVDWTTYKDQSYVGGVPVAGLGRIYVVGKDIFFIDSDGNATSMIAAGAGGDSIKIDGVNVTDPDFVSTGDIDFVDTSNTVTANINVGAVKLNDIGDPDGNTSINADGFSVGFIFDNPAGAFEIKATGNYTSHGLLSVIQETGNPGDTHLIHVEAEDPDVLPLHIKKTDDTASVPLMEYEGDRATPTDNDEIYQWWELSDDAGNQDEMMRMSVVATDVSTTTEDASITWDLIQDGALTEVMVLNSLGGLALDNVVVSNIGLHVLDTNASHDLIYKPGSDLTADRTLTTTTGDSDRTITLSGNPTLDDWFDQSVKSGTSPTFDGANITGVSAANVSIATGGGSPTIDQVQEYFDNTGSSGYFTGGTLSDGGAGTLDVAAGEGFIRTTNDDNAELQSFKWSASSTIAVTDDTTQYVYVDDSGVISLSTSEFLETPDKILIGVVTDEGAAIESVFQLGVRLEEGIGQAGRFMRGVHGIVRNKRVGGLIFGQSGDANRDVTMTTGQIEWGRTSYTMSAFDTSGADTFTTYSANGQEDATASGWPNAQYDNAGTLTTMTNNRWANLFFWLEPNDKIIMVYGRAEFVSQAGAEAEDVPSSSLPTRISETGLLATRFTFQKSANTATIESAFDTLFANAAVSDHANLATLAWTSAGHTGSVSVFAGFDGAGAANEYTESNYLLTDGTRALAGAWSMGSQATTNVNIDSGTIDHEAGGLEADVSGVSGLIAISGGSTSEVDAKSELETQIVDVADFAEADGDVYTGTHDFGGADDLEVPNSATPTVDTAGQIALDTTITDHDGLIIYFQGAEVMVIPAIPLGDLTTTDGHVIDYNAAGNKFTMDSPAAGGETNSLEVVTTGIATTEIPIGTAPDTVVYATLSSDVTMDNAGAVTIAANAVALTTDTTGNYAAGDAEAGAALTGDAAVDFFGAGVDAVTDTTTCTDIEGTSLTITASTLNVDAASTTAAGGVELATTAEIDTGTDSTRAIPVDQLVASKRNIRWLVFNLVEAATDCATATNIAGDFVSPIAGTVLQSDTTPFYLYATNSTAGTTGTMVVDISFGGTSIMTTNKLDFDTTEKTTTTAATPPDLTDTTLAVGDIITIDIDAIHTTAAKGLTVYMAIRE